MKQVLYILTIIMLWGCGGKKNDPTPTDPVKPQIGTVTPILPANNEACLTGVTLSPQTSLVTFNWGKTANAGIYELRITNLLTKANIVRKTNEASLAEVLERGTPYSWMVTAISADALQTATGPVWKFYNAGPANTTYAPFPAELQAPALNANLLLANKLDLQWKSSSVSNNIVDHDVYLGTAVNPPLYKGKVTTPFLMGEQLTAKGVYYWKIVTRDANGNTSTSDLFQFVVN